MKYKFYDKNCNYAFPWSTTSRYSAFLYDKEKHKDIPDYPPFDRKASFYNVDSCIGWLIYLIESIGGVNASWYEANIDGDDFTKQYRSYDTLLEDLWKTFIDVNFTENEKTEWNWFIFPAGTDKEHIWHWFDTRYSKGVYHLIYKNDQRMEDSIRKRECKIMLYPDCFHPPCIMILSVPNNMDAEEYIDNYLDSILNENLKFNAEWKFC